MASASTQLAFEPDKDHILVHKGQLELIIKTHISGNLVDNYYYYNRKDI